MAFTDLQQKAISEFAVQAAHASLAKLSLFSHTFTELEGRYGESIAVPVYNLSACADFNADSNNYGSGVNEIGGMLVSLDKHLVKSVSISDKQIAFTGTRWVEDTTKALVENLVRGANAYVFGLINSDNVTLSVENDLSSTDVIADLYATCVANDIPAEHAIIALTPTYFKKVMVAAGANLVGDGEYVKTGVIGNLFGFKGFVCTNNLPAGTKGAIIFDEAIGIASKYLAPMTADAYPEAYQIKVGEGLTLGARRFMDLAKGQDFYAMDLLFGAKLLQADKIIRIV